ncbi:ATG8-interacting protein 1-like [Rutidosis leptorrhynchoides]|uniref:ATG8-interacting protein 1-like n=1 Tax=Rutidosis leptorrhynchoides TaxID=125765 RepID=UPI003A996C1E
MADKEDGEEIAPRGADWEVVSLTASTYAAAPGPYIGDTKGGDKGDVVETNENETSNALFMSGHFVFPPSQHENLPLEPENAEILGDQGESIKEEGGKSYAKDEDNWNIGKLTEFDVEFANSTTLPGLNLAGKEQNIYNSAKFDSFHSEPMMVKSNMVDEDRVLTESIGSSDSVLGSDVPSLHKQSEEDKYDGFDLPYSAWLKKRAASLYHHAKETNTFWSIFIAAAMMGLVIIGQQWQQERWQILHHKWRIGVYDERFGRMMGPISRLKDVIVGGNRRGFSIRGSTSSDH